MRIIIYIVGVLLLVVIQASFFGQFRVLGVMPNLLLIAIILNGLYATASSTVAIALAGGLFLDLASGEDFGIRMAFFTLAALGVIVIRQLGFRLDGILMVGLLAALGTAAFNAIIIASMGLSSFSQSPTIMRIIGAEVILNCIIIGLIQGLLVAAGVSSSQGEPGMRKRSILQGR